MVFKISLNGNLPIYEQLIEKIENMVLLGVLEPDTPIPSVRDFAAELAINPNTVQKAFSELDKRGVTYSVSGKGRFVTNDVSKIINQKSDMHISCMLSSVSELIKLGIDKDILIHEIEKLYKEGDK